MARHNASAPVGVVGAAIKRRRLERRLSLRAVGKPVGINHVTLRRWEDGEGAVNADYLPAVAAVLGTSIAELFDGHFPTSALDGTPESRVKRVLQHLQLAYPFLSDQDRAIADQLLSALELLTRPNR